MKKKTKNKEEKPPGLEKSAERHNESKKLPWGSRFKAGLARTFGLDSSLSIESEVNELIEEIDPEGKQISSEERSMLSNILGLNEVKVSDVMIPRTDIVALEKSVNLEEIRKVLVDKEHTRMPVYDSSLDNIIGFLHIKDLIPLFGSRKQFAVTSVLRQILFVPPSMRIVDLLVKMRAKRVHVAIVLDEYGGTDGLVTMEDLVEEIVGDIEDEHDEDEPLEITEIDNDTLEVSARIDITELEKKLNVRLRLPENTEDFDTVGGLIFFILGKIPKKGEIIEHPSGVEFEVTEADPRHIKKLLVRKIAV